MSYIDKIINKKGGFKKISEPVGKDGCCSKEHKPPAHIVLPAGTYEYTCPFCGDITLVRIPLVTC